MNYHYGITQNFTCTCNSLLSLSLFSINVLVIIKLLYPLIHYHIIYLIIELPLLNLMFNNLKIVLSLSNLSLTTLQLLQKLLTSLLLPKYHNKTNVVLNTANFGVYFYPQPSRDFSPPITQQSF